MPAEFSLLERNRIVNDIYNGADFEIRAYTNTISATGTGGTEVAVSGYSPIQIANNTANFPLAVNGTRSNAVAFSKTFEAGASIVSIGIFATVSGDFLGRQVYAQPLEVEAGQLWRFPIGSISFAANNPA